MHAMLRRAALFRTTPCCAAQEVMRDPVMVRESCETYDRASIEEWFRKGNRTDPVTGGSILGKRGVGVNNGTQVPCCGARAGKGEP